MKELKTGWLSPTGEFFESGLYEHIDVARKLTDGMGLCDYDFKTNRTISADEQLERIGWVYIGIGVYFEHEWRIGWGMQPLTPEQRTFLKPYFEDSDIPMNQVAKDRWELEL